ncbi:hypothetical protein [Sphingomonas montanisoli]|uniref:Uncharacterized protein n=1 Tax=Sphingomonas montanisoli TaxID=2606412 RepID=A0A5D9C3R2_9SPHN|nr:hypothetical protein [Sphingomonas montanisoli]TZG26488.1 hypothetical protein FYJ91_16325 [Sphingomonas montanisoli]
MTIVAISCACCPAEGEAIELVNPREDQLLYGYLPLGWRLAEGDRLICPACSVRFVHLFEGVKPAVLARLDRHGPSALGEIAAIVGVPIEHARRWCAEWERQQERTAA